MKHALRSGAALLLACVVLASAPPGAAAQENGAIIQVTGVSSPRLAVYERATNDSKLREFDKAAVKLPLDVFETANEDRFLKIQIAGDHFWVKAAQVIVLRAISAGCLAQSAAPVPAGVIRGGNRGCTK